MTDIIFNNKPYICKVFTTHVGTLAIKLSSYDGESTIQPTVWLSEIAKNELAIADYYQYAGILNTLIQAKVIHPPHRYCNDYPICYLYDNK